MHHILMSVMISDLSWQSYSILTSSDMSNDGFDYSIVFHVFENMGKHNKIAFLSFYISKA